MKERSLLLPGGFRPLGFALSGIGLVLAAIRFWFGLKPEWLNREVFAVYSYYVSTKTFTVIKNQLLEEIAGVLILLGLLFLVTAKERDEFPGIDRTRASAFLISAYIMTLVLVIAMMTTYGFAFGFMMILCLGLWQITYYIIFRILIYKHRKEAEKAP